MTRDASAECLYVRTHGALRSVRIMIADGGENGFVLLLEAVMTVRRGDEMNQKRSDRSLSFPHDLGQLEVFRCVLYDGDIRGRGSSGRERRARRLLCGPAR